MNNDEFKIKSAEYSEKITNLIEQNIKYIFFIDETIKWTFASDGNIAIVATCNKETNLIRLNLDAVICADKNNDFKTIEYFLLHEIRYVFQHKEINRYKNKQKTSVSASLIKLWLEESKNYVPSLNEKGEENPQYFLQDCEMDAYAFAFAVMKHKYSNISSLYVPPIYSDEFYKIVKEWEDIFNNL